MGLESPDPLLILIYLEQSEVTDQNIKPNNGCWTCDRSLEIHLTNLNIIVFEKF